MWCRAVITITLLACTFQRTNGQSHDRKDLLCVLILSGLQKEDLDVVLLRKLQRHNVNVDDLDNAAIRNECKLENANTSDNETKNNVWQTTRKRFEGNRNTSDKVENQNIEVNSTKDAERITKLIKLISITPEINLNGIKEDTTTARIVAQVKDGPESGPNSITYIHKVLQQFIAQAAILPTTTKPATTVDLRSLLYEIKNMLANKSVNNRKDSIENKNGRQEDNYDDKSFKTKVYTTAVNDRMMNRMKAMRRQKENVELIDRSQEVSNERPIDDDSKPTSPSQPLTKTTQPLTKTSQPLKKESFKNDINVIQGSIIKDIAESVKAIVLQDLKKEMSTTTTTTTSRPIATKTDVETTTIASTTQENEFAQFIQLYQHFKNKMIPVVNKNVTAEIQHGTISTIKVPSTLPIIPNNPYENPIIRHIIHNIQVPNDVTNLNTELQSLPIYKSNSIHRIDQVNIFNPKHESHPITMQTNIGQIPPLKIPMMASPQRLIYQNIIVTTENYFEYFKNIHRLQASSNANTLYFQNNDNIKSNLKPQHENTKLVDSLKHYDYLQPFDHPKYHYQIERTRTPSNYMRQRYNPKHEYANMRNQNHNFEKFHEKLERADRDEWQQRSNEYTEKMKVAPRQLRPLNDNKQKFDDTHFRNFLKTQEKVNDMLERILATKTIETPKSVELP